MVREKRVLKKKVWIFGLVLLLLLLIIGGVAYWFYYNDKQLAQQQKQETKLLEDINSHYNEIVEINSDSSLYEKKDNKYVKVGGIASGEIVALEKENITVNTKYFQIKDLGYYIEYKNVKKADRLVERDQRYKKYLVFNENVITKDKVKLYRDDKLVYTLNFSLDKEIILKDDNGYYIEYFGELLFIKSEDVLSTRSVQNTTEEEASGIPVTVYHFIYLNGDTSCNEMICHSENQIREHFNYLKTNEFFTMTTTELRLYLEGKLRAPKKSILITIDDGSRAWNFIPLLVEYIVNAILFLISGWYEKEKFASPYMELASHTHNLHTPGVCPGGQGSPLKCADKTSLVADLKLSREILNGTEAFCFPFYEYNDYAISVLQEAGFKMAFIGGYRKAVRGDNLYKVPRIPLTDYTTLAQYANYIN